MTRKEFIYRDNDPFKNDGTSYYDDHDINTIGCDEIFEGVSTEMIYSDDEDIKLVNSQKRIFNYDVVKSFNSNSYIRTITIKPGIYSEKWDIPSLEELELFNKLLEDVYSDAGYLYDIKDHNFYK